METGLNRIPVRTLTVSIMLTAASGCSTHTANLTKAITTFKAGNDAAAIAIVEKGRESKRCKQICCLEAGRLKMLSGRISESKTDFMEVINDAAEIEDGAIIRLRGTSGKLLASTLTDDRAIHYRLAGYELVMLLQEQALNHLFSGDVDAAVVEIRRAVYAQDKIAEEYEKEIEAARKKIGDDKKMTGYNQKVKNKYVAMGPVLGRAKNSFQNPYVWYSSGIMYETAGEPGNAYISYKKAWELMPDNEYLQKDLLRLAKTENQDEYTSFKDRFTGIDADKITNTKTEIIIFFEEGLISRRYSESMTLPIPMPKGGYTFQTAAFPVYRDGVYTPAPIGLKLDGKNKGRTAVICYLQSLAYYDLMEKMPGILLRNFTRGFTRATAQQALSDQGAEYQAVSLLWQIFNSAADRADTRAWYTIPMAVQIARLPLTAGTHKLNLVNQHSGLNTVININLQENERKLVWVADMGGRASSCVVSLMSSMEKIPGTFAVTSSVLSAPVFQTLQPGTAGNEAFQTAFTGKTPVDSTSENPVAEPVSVPAKEKTPPPAEETVEDVTPDTPGDSDVNQAPDTGKPEPEQEENSPKKKRKGRITVF